MIETILTLLLLVQTAKGPIGGATFLSAMAGPDRFPCSQAMRTFKGSKTSVAHMAVGWNFLGKDRSCLRKFIGLSSKKLVILQIVPTCARCRQFPEIYGPQPAPANRRLIQSITSFATRRANGNTIFLLSQDLEDKDTDKAARAHYEKIKLVWPFEVIRNSVFHHIRFRADFNELHGKGAKCSADSGRRENADLDGSQLSWPDARAWLKRNTHCGLVRLWRCAWQGTCEGYIEPDRRRYSVPRADIFALKRVFERLNK